MTGGASGGRKAGQRLVPMIAGPEGGPSSDMQRSRAPHEIHYTFITANFKKSDGRYIEHYIPYNALPLGPGSAGFRSCDNA
jgi:hypothetical protein